MLLATRQKYQLRQLHLNLKDSCIEQVHEHRQLGVITDDEFSWRLHITATCKTVSKNLYVFSQLKHFVDTPKRKLFHHAHISPHLTCASTVCNGCSDSLFNQLNSLRRRAAKLIISDSSLTTDTKLRYLGLLPLNEKLMFSKAVLVFKAYRNLVPPYLKQLFIKSASEPFVELCFEAGKWIAWLYLDKGFRSRFIVKETYIKINFLVCNVYIHACIVSQCCYDFIYYSCFIHNCRFTLIISHTFVCFFLLPPPPPLLLPYCSL